jgi:hypothetical protein
MGLFDRLVGGASAPNGQGQQNQPDPRQGYFQMKQNPTKFFAQLGINIPDGMSNPYEIAAYIKKTNQIPIEKLTMAEKLDRGRPR